MITIEALPEEKSKLGPVEYVLLDWDRRRKGRQKCTTDKGTELSIALPRGQNLADGTIIYNCSERTIQVKAQPQAVIKLVPQNLEQACKVAHHAGNWHRSVQLHDGEITLEQDGPLQSWLEQNKIPFALAQAPFTPNLRGDAHD